MKINNILHVILVVFFLENMPLLGRDCDGRDVFLEFKGGAFIPTGCDFRAIYGNATFFVSPEFSWQVVDRANWYIFASAGYVEKKGNSVGLCTPTKARLVPLGIGVKYFFQNFHDDICSNHKVYLGLGFQPVLLKTNNRSEYVEQNSSDWGLGGVAKFGYILDLKRNFFIDFFADYSFAHVGCGGQSSDSKVCCSLASSGIRNVHYVTPLKANVSGMILGIGIGYSF